MALSPEEKAQLQALQDKEKEDPPEDEYIEIWDETGSGAKVKRSSAKGWLNKFGIDLDEEVTEETESKDTKPKPKRETATDNPGHAARYFGSKRAG